MTMLNRVKQLEMASRPMGRMHWIRPSYLGQTRAEATAEYEALHGPMGEDDFVLSWNEFAKETPTCAS